MSAEFYSPNKHSGENAFVQGTFGFNLRAHIVRGGYSADMTSSRRGGQTRGRRAKYCAGQGVFDFAKEEQTVAQQTALIPDTISEVKASFGLEVLNQERFFYNPHQISFFCWYDELPKGANVLLESPTGSGKTYM